MGRVRHKRKNSHVVIVTSDAADAGVKQFRIKPWILQTMVMLLCVAVGALIGYFIYVQDIWEADARQTTRQQNTISALEQEKTELEEEIGRLNGQIDELNEQVRILSDTVAQKVQSESELLEQLENLTLPTRFPVTGKATMETVTEGGPACIITAATGSMVVATANGTVIVVNDDTEYGYGHNVWIDHGNGYVTIYKNQGTVRVRQGETVAQGATIFLIDEGNEKLFYQMTKDGEYIDPMDMLSVDG